MKKLMIAAAIVCAAVMSQAATYNWAASCDGIYAPAELDDGSGALISGLPVYIFDANVVSIDSFTAEMTTADLSTLLGKALLNDDSVRFTTGADFGAFTATGKGDFDGGATNPGAVGLSAIEGKGAAYAVILDNADPTAATTFFVTAPVENIDCTGNVASMGDNAAITFGEIDASGDWNTITTAAPEPTSGLLLLLGIAGLALKRKRA